MISRDEIREWLEEAREMGATHMLVVCDTFDWEDYPVFVKPGDSIHDNIAHFHGKNMQKIMEVYSMSEDLEEQLSEHLNWRI